MGERLSESVSLITSCVEQIAYPPGVRFDHPYDQEAFVRKWLIEDAHLPQAAERLDIRFYSGR